MMTLEEFNRFLLDKSGVSSRVLYNLWSKTDDPPTQTPTGSLFFRPYQSSLHTLGRGVNIISDPLVITYFAGLHLVLAMYHLVHSIGDAFSDKDKAIDSLGTSASCFLIMISAIFTAAISPLVNLVDLIGGGIKSLVSDEDAIQAAIDAPIY